MFAEQEGFLQWAPCWPDGTRGTVLSFVDNPRAAERNAAIEAVMCGYNAHMLKAHKDSMPVPPDPWSPYTSKARWAYEIRKWRGALVHWERRVRQAVGAVAS